MRKKSISMEEFPVAPGEAGAELGHRLWCQSSHRLCTTHSLTARQREAPHFQVFGVDQGFQPMAGLQSFPTMFVAAPEEIFFFSFEFHNKKCGFFE